MISKRAEFLLFQIVLYNACEISPIFHFLWESVVDVDMNQLQAAYKNDVRTRITRNRKHEQYSLFQIQFVWWKIYIEPEIWVYGLQCQKDWGFFVEKMNIKFLQQYESTRFVEVRNNITAA